MRMTNVTTRTGDDGDTYLGNGQRVSKDSLRIEVCGALDELSSVLGLALAKELDPEIVPWVQRVQNDLFRLGADLCMPGEDKRRLEVPQIEQGHVERLEAETGRLLEKLAPLREFILPGGARGAACLHVARTVCRRAERSLVALSRKEPVGAFALKYLNRLSDWLFVLARHENRLKGFREASWDKTV